MNLRRKIGNIDFDFIVKDLSKQFTLKEKRIKNKLSNTLEKSKIIKKCKLVKKKLKNIYENKSNKKNDKNANLFKKNDIKFKINDENKRICFDKDILFLIVMMQCLEF